MGLKTVAGIRCAKKACVWEVRTVNLLQMLCSSKLLPTSASIVCSMHAYLGDQSRCHVEKDRNHKIL
jgi:hypothetical protein